MYLMIDNYDSFTYNLYALFKECNADLKVIKNDQFIPAEEYDAIIISPGPSRPENAGTTIDYLKAYIGKKPIFGVCLGMQSIAYAMGYSIVKARTIKHGKVDEIQTKKNSILFKGLPESFNVVRYHSLAADIDDTYITSISTDDQVPMSIEDHENKVYGVQFHPESILSENGKLVIKNFMDQAPSTASGIVTITSPQEGNEQMDSLIKKVNSGEILSYEEALELFDFMATGKLTEAQIASTLIMLKMRGETVDELAALITTLNKYKKSLNINDNETIDTCGTGGDGKSTVNVSTAVSIILASLGYKVVKHGNKAQSGKVGSADILADLGLDLSYSNSSAEEFYHKHNYVFMMAPFYHPALKGIGKVRKELKVPTIFNFVGPLVNPANPTYQVIGINKRDKLEFIANTILRLDRSNVTVYSSFDGYDEVSSNDKTECMTVNNSTIKTFTINPSDFFTPFPMPTINDNDEAKQLFIEGLQGTNEQIVNILALNTALALKTMGKHDLPEGFKIAKEHLIQGKVYKKLTDICNN